MSDGRLNIAAEAALDRFLANQAARPQYHQRVAEVRSALSLRHVSPEIIDRVIRLNPTLEEGVLLRGIHYTGDNDPRLWLDATTMGDFIRRFGREACDRLPAGSLFKRGRRKYVTRQGAMAAGAAQ